jgi:hypothetical protein
MSTKEPDFAFKDICTDELIREPQNTEQSGS